MRLEYMKKFLLILSACALIAVVGIATYYGVFNSTKPQKYEYMYGYYKTVTFDSPPLPACPSGQQFGDFMTVASKEELGERIANASKLLEKDEKGLELWETPFGRYWMPPDNFIVFTWILAELAADIYGDHSVGVRPGDIVLDCGAHVGVFARHALRQGAKLVVAIEIAPDNIEFLERNLADEIASGSVIVYPKGVWDKDDTLELNVDTYTAGHSVILEREEGFATVSVPLTTIDKIVDELGLPRVDFIKMDIEGAERNALAGATNTLYRFKPRMAIAGYHLIDDLTVLPEIALNAQPMYKACLLESDWAYSNVIIFQ
ncbi:MAG: FkbM family methyltransferase [Deltaproteobacteria bacterium]|nr:FkbM family methyltransferase [Deltaproteobacteria bacterium]